MKYKLGDFIDCIKGYAFKSKDFRSNGIPIVRVSNLNQGLIKNNNWIYLDVNMKDKFNKYELKEDDAVISTVGSWKNNPNSVVGKCCIIHKGNEGNLLNQNAVIVRSKTVCLSQKYLGYILNSFKFQSYIEGCAQGSASQASITLRDIQNYMVDMPHISIQNKITKILDSLDKKIELNNQINNNLQEIAKAIFIKWFYDFDYLTIDSKPYRSSGGKMINSELGKIPEKWKVGLFQDIVEFSNGYGFKSSDLLDKEAKNTLKVFKQGNINLGGGFSERKTKSWIYKEKCSGLEKFILKKGDILMCMTDMKNSTSPLLGHTALMNVDNEYIVNQRVGLIRCKKEITDYPYVYTMTNLECFLRDIRSRANSGVQVNLSTKGICETRIIIPTKDIIDKYNNVVKPLYEKIFNNQKENQNLKSLKEIVLPKLLNGELNIEDVKI